MILDKNFSIKGSQVTTSIELAMIEIESEVEAFLSRANIEVLKLREQDGLSKQRALDTVIGQVEGQTDFAKAFFNRIDKITQEIGKQTVAKPVREYGKKNPQQLYKWHLGSVKSVHCPDCLSLASMEAQTIAGWLSHKLGLPREGKTACNVGCKCLLEPVAS